MSFALRVKTKSGHQVIKSLTPEHTIKDLKVQLSKVSNIPQDRLHVLSGYPPKVLDITQGQFIVEQKWVDFGGDLILEEKAPPPVPKETSSAPSQNFKSHITENDSDYPGILMKKVVPADNSCLFSSIFFRFERTIRRERHRRPIYETSDSADCGQRP
jgi:ubiquitin thioesterase OTU1